MKKILSLALTLFAVCAITAGVLGVVNELTKDTIAMHAMEETLKAFEAVLSSTDGYSSENDIAFDKSVPEFAHVDQIVSRTSGGELVGHVVVSTVSGAQGMVTLAVGVDTDFLCTGISVISHSETAGLGANAASPAEVGVNFRAQFVGQDDSIALSKSGGSIDALSGATITSQACVDAVADSIQAVRALG